MSVCLSVPLAKVCLDIHSTDGAKILHFLQNVAAHIYRQHVDDTSPYFCPPLLFASHLLSSPHPASQMETRTNNTIGLVTLMSRVTRLVIGKLPGWLTPCSYSEFISRSKSRDWQTIFINFSQIIHWLRTIDIGLDGQKTWLMRIKGLQEMIDFIGWLLQWKLYKASL